MTCLSKGIENRSVLGCINCKVSFCLECGKSHNKDDDNADHLVMLLALCKDKMKQQTKVKPKSEEEGLDMKTGGSSDMCYYVHDNALKRKVYAKETCVYWNDKGARNLDPDRNWTGVINVLANDSTVETRNEIKNKERYNKNSDRISVCKTGDTGLGKTSCITVISRHRKTDKPDEQNHAAKHNTENNRNQNAGDKNNKTNTEIDNGMMTNDNYDSGVRVHSNEQTSKISGKDKSKARDRIDPESLDHDNTIIATDKHCETSDESHDYETTKKTTPKDDKNKPFSKEFDGMILDSDISKSATLNYENLDDNNQHGNENKGFVTSDTVALNLDGKSAEGMKDGYIFMPTRGRAPGDGNISSLKGKYTNSDDGSDTHYDDLEFDRDTEESNVYIPLKDTDYEFMENPTENPDKKIHVCDCYLHKVKFSTDDGKKLGGNEKLPESGDENIYDYADDNEVEDLHFDNIKLPSSRCVDNETTETLLEKANRTNETSSSELSLRSINNRLNDKKFNVPDKTDRAKIFRPLDKDNEQYWLPDKDKEQYWLLQKNKGQDRLPEKDKEQYRSPDNYKEQYWLPDKDKEQYWLLQKDKEKCRLPRKDKEQYCLPDKDKEQFWLLQKDKGQDRVPEKDKEQYWLPDKDKEQYWLPDKDKEQYWLLQEDKEKCRLPRKDKEQYCLPDKDKEQYCLPDKDIEQYWLPQKDKEKYRLPRKDKEQYRFSEKDKEQYQLRERDKAQYRLPENNKKEHRLSDEERESRDRPADNIFIVQVIQSPSEVGILSGNFYLHIMQDGIKLLTKNKARSLFWPFNGIRRFGKQDNSSCFSIEAGRRCESGPGEFVFKSEFPHEIYKQVLKMSKNS